MAIFKGIISVIKCSIFLRCIVAHPGMEVNDKNGYFPRYFVKWEFKLLGSRPVTR